MRYFSLIAALLASSIGCNRASKPNYSPVTFRTDIGRLVANRDYAGAVALVESADIGRQLAHDGSGYVGIGEDAIVLSGIENQVQYDPNRDWYVPGTQDAIEDMARQKAAAEFARQYNRRRLANSP